MSKLEVEMITPEKVALRASADFVVLPATKGELGVLPGHAPFLVELKAGEVRVTAEGALKSFAIAGGFAEIQRDKVAVFAETADLAEEIDAEATRQALEKAKAQSQRSDLDPLSLKQAEAAIRAAQVRLRVAELKTRRGHRPSGPQGHGS